MASDKQFDVYGLGSAIMDYQLKATDAQIVELELSKGEMRLVDRDEQSKILSVVGSGMVNRASGGSAANSMIALAQLGGSAAFCCLVGDDADGKFYIEEMRNLGVKVHTAPVAGATTGASLILITPDAERTMNTHLGINEQLGPQNVDEELLVDSEWLYVEGYLFSSESGQNTVARAIDIAKSNGVKIAVTCSDGFIVDVFGSHLATAVDAADLVFANLNEAQKFTGETELEKVAAQLEAGTKSFVVTLGAEGAFASFEGQHARVPGIEITAVDATGAGDMFAGSFLFGLSRGYQLEPAIELACKLAAEVVAQPGPRLSGDVKRYIS